MSCLAQVLPLNIWTYVLQESNLARLGKRFVLQGGTQKNLAAVKAQVDFIKRRVPGSTVFVHRYADISGAIGAALEVRDHGLEHPAKLPAEASTFIGIDAAAQLQFRSKNDGSTRCDRCTNRCRRTFVDIESAGRRVRFISGYLCEKGSVEDPALVREEAERLQAVREQNPDITAEAARWAFSDFDFEPLPAAGIQRSDAGSAQKRGAMVVGIPRLLNMFYYAPLFSTYFRTLGLRVAYSDFTNDRLWSEGNKWGVIDPCFPAKVAPAHIWQLLNRPGLTAICFPIITHLESSVAHTLGNTACAIQMGTPEVAEAIFSREPDLFREKRIA